MAESSLSIGFPELKQEVGFYLGMGRGVDRAWSASQLAEIEGIVQSGIRRVYYPPAITAEIAGYEWSWLRPNKTISTIVGDYDYDLPDDFGRLIGTLHFAASQYRNPLSMISTGKLIDMRACSDETNTPRYATTRYKTSTGSSGQRQELLLFPTPSEIFVLSYEYEAYSGALSTSYPYPLGGMQLAEVYLESCLAMAESRINDTIGLHAQQYQVLLVDAIARDRKRGAQMYGPMGQPKERWDDDYRHGYANSIITYNGVPI